MNNVITMIEQSLKDAFSFSIYYFIIIMFFCAQFMILGNVTSNLDYPGLYGEDEDVVEFRYVFYLIQNFRNSVGDLATPTYKFWEEFDYSRGRYIIAIIWATWIANFVFSSLLMLNFLITIFSETHERVLTNQLEYTYYTRAVLNKQAFALLKSFHLLDETVYSVLTQAKSDSISGNEDEMKGIIQNLTKVVQQYSMKVSHNTNLKFEEIKALIKQSSATSQNQIDDFRSNIHNIHGQLESVHLQISDLK
jgi:hypothetical protein